MGALVSRADGGTTALFREKPFSRVAGECKPITLACPKGTNRKLTLALPQVEKRTFTADKGLLISYIGSGSSFTTLKHNKHISISIETHVHLYQPPSRPQSCKMRTTYLIALFSAIAFGLVNAAPAPADVIRPENVVVPGQNPCANCRDVESTGAR